jgi:hypothetical protein
VIELTICELESFRRSGSVGDDALCTSTCNSTNFVQVEEVACSLASDYPKDLFINEDLKGLSYEERTCCVVNKTTPDLNNQCGLKGGDGIGMYAIIGIASGSFIGAIIIGWMVMKGWQNMRTGNSSVAKTGSYPSGKAPISSLHPIQPPQNPHFNPNASAPLAM